MGRNAEEAEELVSARSWDATWGKPECKPVSVVSTSPCRSSVSRIRRFDSKSVVTINAIQCQTPCPAGGCVEQPWECGITRSGGLSMNRDVHARPECLPGCYGMRRRNRQCKRSPLTYSNGRISVKRSCTSVQEGKGPRQRTRHCFSYSAASKARNSSGGNRASLLAKHIPSG